VPPPNEKSSKAPFPKDPDLQGRRPSPDETKRPNFPKGTLLTTTGSDMAVTRRNETAKLPERDLTHHDGL